MGNSIFVNDFGWNDTFFNDARNIYNSPIDRINNRNELEEKEKKLIEVVRNITMNLDKAKKSKYYHIIKALLLEKIAEIQCQKNKFK